VYEHDKKLNLQDWPWKLNRYIMKIPSHFIFILLQVPYEQPTQSIPNTAVQ
jgi:hypothetical protein